MIYTYCSNMTTQVFPGIYAVDAVLDKNIPEQLILISKYHTSIDADLYDENDITSVENALNPNKVLIDNGRVRLMTTLDVTESDRKYALSKLTAIQRASMLAGAYTSILDTEGNPIKMNSDYFDKLNLDGLLMIMDMYSMESAPIRDFNNVDHVLTRAQIDIIIKDLVLYVASTFNTKWENQVKIQNATSRTELEHIIGMSLL